MSGDHYSTLGVSRSASSAEIRRRFREQVRQLHPDTSSAARPAEMRMLTEAYRVLSNPNRRAAYDRTLTISGTQVASQTPQRPVTRSGPPARFPWRFVIVLAALGTLAVIVSAALAGPTSEMLPDGVLTAGSCVSIDTSGFAMEVRCVGDDTDRRVLDLVPTDGVCRDGSVGPLDRLGLGRVCLAAP